MCCHLYSLECAAKSFRIAVAFLCFHTVCIWRSRVMLSVDKPPLNCWQTLANTCLAAILISFTAAVSCRTSYFLVDQGNIISLPVSCCQPQTHLYVTGLPSSLSSLASRFGEKDRRSIDADRGMRGESIKVYKSNFTSRPTASKAEPQQPAPAGMFECARTVFVCSYVSKCVLM